MNYYQNQSRVSVSTVGTDGEENIDESMQDALFENTSRGTVNGSLFLNYITSGATGIVAFIVLILYLATQASVSLNDYFIPIM